MISPIFTAVVMNTLSAAACIAIGRYKKWSVGLCALCGIGALLFGPLSILILLPVPGRAK